MRAWLVLAMWLPAHAGIVVAPPSQSYLPPRPTIYVFLPGEDVPQLSARTPDGRPVPLRVDLATESPAFRTYRVSVDATEGSFYLFGHWRVPLAYTIDPVWTAPRARAVTVAEKYHERFAYCCEGQTAVYVTPSVDAPAYRLEWAPTAAAYRAGLREKLIFPRRTGAFRERDDGPPELGLGHIGYPGATLPVTDDPVFIGVAALYPDGSQILASARPTEVRVRVAVADGPQTRAAIPWSVEQSVHRLERALRLAVARSQPPRPPPPVPLSDWAKALMTRVATEAAAIAGAIVLLLAAVWHRLRSR